MVTISHGEMKQLMLRYRSNGKFKKPSQHSISFQILNRKNYYNNQLDDKQGSACYTAPNLHEMGVEKLD